MRHGVVTAIGRYVARACAGPTDDRPCSEPLAEVAAAPQIAPRTATALVALSTLGIGLAAVWSVLTASSGPSARYLEMAAVAVLVVAQVALSGRWCDRLRAPVAGVVLVGQAALLALPVLAGRPPWPGLPGLLAGTALFLLPRVAGVLVLAATVVAVATLALLAPGPDTVLRGVLSAAAVVVAALVVSGLTTLVRLLRETSEVRAELHRAIAARERSRVAQDVHDLLGSSLSAVVLRCELAIRLLPGQTARAADELREVVRLSRRARDQVRTATEGRLEVDLAGECEDAERLLAGAGVRTSVRRIVTAPGTPAHGAVLVASLREGVTNVLRHSRATWCEIEVTCDATRTRVVVVNDGADDPPGPAGRVGDGLLNLDRRAVEVGGSTTVASARGVHRLEVQVPRPRGSEPAALAGDAHRVEPIAGVELGDGGREVVANRPRGQEQA